MFDTSLLLLQKLGLACGLAVFLRELVAKAVKFWVGVALAVSLQSGVFLFSLPSFQPGMSL